MDARIVGPEAELGDVRNGIVFYGQTITRDWSKVDFQGEALRKAQGHRYIELREGKAAKSTVDPDAEEATVKARLTELGVEFTDKEKLTGLKAKLDKAEKAQAEAEQEAADAQAQEDHAFDDER